MFGAIKKHLGYEEKTAILPQHVTSCRNISQKINKSLKTSVHSCITESLIVSATLKYQSSPEYQLTSMKGLAYCLSDQVTEHFVL